MGGGGGRTALCFLGRHAPAIALAAEVVAQCSVAVEVCGGVKWLAVVSFVLAILVGFLLAVGYDSFARRPKGRSQVADSHSDRYLNRRRGDYGGPDSSDVGTGESWEPLVLRDAGLEYLRVRFSLPALVGLAGYDDPGAPIESDLQQQGRVAGRNNIAAVANPEQSGLPPLLDPTPSNRNPQASFPQPSDNTPIGR